jgi:hypothetical protein
MRRLYTKQHRFYCGIDLHARLLAICIIDHDTASVVCQTQIPADKQMLLDTLAPYRPDVVVAVECLFAWYWVADLCAKEGIPFVLGQVRGPCLVHGSRTPHSCSFAAHLEKNCWHCFRCGAGGNALDLYLAVRKLPVYEGALELCARLHLPVPRLAKPASRSPP